MRDSRIFSDGFLTLRSDVTGEFSVWFEEAPWVTSKDVFDLLRRKATNGEVELGSSLDNVGLLFVTVPASLPSATENLAGDDSVAILW